MLTVLDGVDLKRKHTREIHTLLSFQKILVLRHGRLAESNQQDQVLADHHGDVAGNNLCLFFYAIIWQTR